MTCRECIDHLPELSADNLTAATTTPLQSHIEQCPHCKQEWLLLNETLYVVSTTSQPLPAPEASQAMWQCCSEHIFSKIESERQSAGLQGWVLKQPRWGWVSLGGALAILGATWFFAPHEEAADLIAGSPFNTTLPAGQAGLGDPGRLITFERPPAGASSLVNHHSAMAADPLADSVGSTMVSYSATVSSGR